MVKKRTTNNRRRTSTTRINSTNLIVFLIVLMLAFSFIGGLAINSNPERQALVIQEQTAVLPWKIASKVTGYVVFGIALKVGGFVLGGLGVYRLMCIGVNWLGLRAKQVQAKNGLFPIIEVQKGVFYDANRDNSGAHPLITAMALDVQKQAALSSQAERVIVRTNTKTPKLPKVEELPMLEQVSNLPDMVRLPNVCQNPSLDTLVLGVSEQGTITASLYDLMHVLSVGASGFGKSAFLRMLIWQLAQVPQDVGIVAIDINGSEFNNIRQWSRLLYPVARDTNAAIATLNAVSQELEYRKGLYENVPTAFDLPSYNALAQEPLAPIACLVDEGTNLLNQSGIGDPLRAVTQVARQYGIYLLLAGQSAKAKVIDTQTRDNFSTRLCFHTSPSSYRAVLGQSVDDVTQKGRAWAQITGETLQQIQTPFVSRQEVQSVLTVGEPQNVIDLEAMPVLPQDDKAQQVLELHEQGKSDTAIAREVFKYGNPHYIGKVREILQQHKTALTTG